MFWNTLFWAVLALFGFLLTGGLLGALKRKGRARKGQSEEESAPPIYASGVYSLLRTSPRAQMLSREPAVNAVAAILREKDSTVEADTMATRYVAEWRRVAELSINNVEKGDRDGVQTYRYQVPDKCRSCCGMFGGDAYVTREQLHNHVQLIPPFHLGCGVILVSKDAWDPGPRGVGGAGWTPILPVNGKYTTPDWRTVVPF